MKTIIISISILFAAVQFAAAQGRFIIEGTLDIEDGVVDIWKHEYECRRDSTDFIATAEVRNGHFRIECDDPGVLVCRVYRTGYTGWNPIFAEPGTFTPRLGERNKEMLFSGGSRQKIFNEFLSDYYMDAWRRYKALLAEYDNNLDKNFDKIRPRANAILKDLIASLDGFFAKYSDQDVTAYVLYMLSFGADIGTPEPKALKAKYSQLAEGPRNTPYGRRTAETIRKLETGRLQ